MRIIRVHAAIINNKKLLLTTNHSNTTLLPGVDVPAETTMEDALRSHMKDFYGIEFNQTLPIGKYTQDAFNQETLEVYLLLVNRYKGELKPKQKSFWADRKALESVKMPTIFMHKIIPDLIKHNLI